VSERVGPFVGHYHDRVYCAACQHCGRELTLMASHANGECFMLAICETCDGGLADRMWGEA